MSRGCASVPQSIRVRVTSGACANAGALTITAITNSQSVLPMISLSGLTSRVRGAPLQQRRRLLGHRGPLEEARVLRAPQSHRVAEDEVVKIALGDEPVLDQLERLGEGI